MKNTFLSIVLFLFSTIVFSQDFLPFKFGTPLENIQQYYSPFSVSTRSNNDVKFFFTPDDKNVKIAGIECSIFYTLPKGKLERVRFFTQEKYDDLNKYLRDYKKIKKLLSKKYELIETREFWDDETYKNDPSKYAVAISLGHYIKSTTYRDGPIEIVHVLRASPNPQRGQHIYQIIDYSSENMIELDKTNTYDLTLRKNSSTVGEEIKTIVIGTQTWMAEDLKTGKFNDGTIIPYVRDSLTWTTLTTPAYHTQGYEKLVYNFYTIIDNRGICPTGWRMPTQEDWATLIDFIGEENVKETLMDKEEFNATLDGFRSSNGGYFGKGISKQYWSATGVEEPVGELRGVSFSINQGEKGFYLGKQRARMGHSVRCIKDN